jgi:hypothetical protein
VNAEISYFIDNTNAAGIIANTKFAVDPATGEVTVNGDRDYETTKYYVLNISAFLSWQ